VIRKAVAATFIDGKNRKISFILIVKNMLAKTKPNTLYFLIISVCYLFQYYQSGLIYQSVNKNYTIFIKLSENHHQKYLLIRDCFTTFFKLTISCFFSFCLSGRFLSNTGLSDKEIL